MKKLTRVYQDIDLLTWVGEGAYPTIDDFVEEAQLLGCSRRLPGLMDWIIPQKTRVFLAHRNGHDDDAYGSLFGFFTINSVHVIYDDIGCGRNLKAARPILKAGVKPPKDQAEFMEYVVKRKAIFVHREVETANNSLDELLDEFFKEFCKEAIKKTVQNGKRYVPWSFEADNLERLCGGASGLGSGRYPGVYCSDGLGDWILDQILDLLLDEPELPEEYFWEEVVEEEKIVRRRRKQKKANMGISRSKRVSIEEIHRRYGEPPSRISRIIVFDKPYPLYYHPPKASFRGFQRIDGDSLLLKVGLQQFITS